MAKITKKNKNQKLFTKQDFLAVLWGLGALYGGTAILTIFVIIFRDVFGIEPTGNLVLILFSILMLAYSGWLVMQKASNKAIYMAALPILVVTLLFAVPWVLAPFQTLTIMNLNEIGWYGIVVLVAFQLLGGLAAKRVKFK